MHNILLTIIIQEIITNNNISIPKVLMDILKDRLILINNIKCMSDILIKKLIHRHIRPTTNNPSMNSSINNLLLSTKFRLLLLSSS